MSKENGGNLKMINGENKPNLYKESLRNIIENQLEILEYHLITAKLYKSKYDSLIKEGFTREQAMELLKLGPI